MLHKDFHMFKSRGTINVNFEIIFYEVKMHITLEIISFPCQNATYHFQIIDDEHKLWKIKIIGYKNK